MAESRQVYCPDCQTSMREIQLLSPHQGSHEVLQFRYADVKKGFFDKPTDGTIRGYLCGQCQRVVFYGELHQETSPNLEWARHLGEWWHELLHGQRKKKHYEPRKKH